MQQAEGTPILAGRGNGDLQQFAQAQSVGQPGQGVGVGHLADGRFRLDRPGAGAQGGDAEAQVIGHGQQQLHFLLVEGVGLGGHDHQHADRGFLDL
ncbi:hypothetical protein FQZ97_1129610 [compost metagenome]